MYPSALLSLREEKLVAAEAFPQYDIVSVPVHEKSSVRLWWVAKVFPASVPLQASCPWQFPEVSLRSPALSSSAGAVSYTHLTLPTNREV